MARGLGGKAPANLQNYLKGAQYPSSKEDLLSTARSNGAPSEVVEVLQELPSQQFGGPQDVMKAYGQLDEGERRTT